jgi:hypothetical protein
MTSQFCFASILIILLAPSVRAQTLLSEEHSLQPGACSENRQGSLDPKVLPVNTDYLEGLIAKAAVKDLFDVLWESENQKQLDATAPNPGFGKPSLARALQAGKSSQNTKLPPLYLDPSSIGPEMGGDDPTLRMERATKIQFFYERTDPIERKKGSRCDVLRTLVAVPAAKADSLEAMLSGNKMFNRFMKDLQKLEIVSVPEIRKARDYSSCRCLKVNTLTVIPSRVLDDGSNQSIIANSASFHAGSPLRREKEKLEYEAASFISDLRAWQRANPDASLAEDTLFSWAGKEAVEQWLAFWSNTREATERLRREDEATRKIIAENPTSSPTDPIQDR